MTCPILPVEWGHNEANNTKRIEIMRLSKLQKDIIAYRVSSEWLESAKRILSEGGKPVKFSDSVRELVWFHVCKICGNDEDKYETVSDKTLKKLEVLSRYRLESLVHNS